MASVFLFYGGRVVEDVPGNPKYVGGVNRICNVNPEVSVEEFVAFVRDNCRIKEDIPITIKSRVLLSGSIAMLVDVCGCETLKCITSQRDARPQSLAVHATIGEEIRTKVVPCEPGQIGVVHRIAQFKPVHVEVNLVEQEFSALYMKHAIRVDANCNLVVDNGGSPASIVPQENRTHTLNTERSVAQKYMTWE